MELCSLDIQDIPGTKFEDRAYVEIEEAGRKGLQICAGELEEPTSRSKPPPVRRMFRTLVLLLEMHEGSGQLNEALEKLFSGSLSLEPEMFQYVVGLVVLLFVKADEVPGVTWVVLGPRAQRVNVSLDSFAFFHSRSS
jgi:hypothetical protein